MRYTLPAQVRLDEAGAGTASITTRHPLTVRHWRVTVAPLAGETEPTSLPRALLFINGQEFEGTYTGSNDSSDTVLPLDGGDVIDCQWSGGDPGALATLIVRGTD